MGRWTQYDEDDYRLPEGMTRVGYDSDTGKYYFRDKDGSMWEGAEGAQYGEMRRASDVPIAIPEAEGEDVESGPRRADGYAPLAPGLDQAPTHPVSDSSYRMLFPFFLIVIVVLLLVLRVFVFPHSSSHDTVVLCPKGSTASTIVAGDTCWDIAEAHGCKLDDIMKLNPALQCEALKPGNKICVPLDDTSS
ncbi:hypothetical protein EVG20_g11202 [Dentipellis fragilis]|uniref:LysM domain-containing protein n=1 Tax=Dentipellis fragilis TaxID=205917 RepID=A0A4Y9XP79_9AGAM|nr:hypothetical protein EVG20_g11202 [Dentipellis fragilis]